MTSRDYQRILGCMLLISGGRCVTFSFSLAAILVFVGVFMV